MGTFGKHLIKDGWVVIFALCLGLYLAWGKYFGS